MNENIKIVCIHVGLGYQKREYLQKNYQKTTMLTLPEPTESFDKGIDILYKNLQKIKPDILIAGSRGGKYIKENIDQIYQGSILLISTMCKEIPKRNCVLVVHGKKDCSIPIDCIRGKVSCCLDESKYVKLNEYDDEHSMNCLLNDKLFDKQIDELLELKMKKKECDMNDMNKGKENVEINTNNVKKEKKNVHVNRMKLMESIRGMKKK